MVIGLVALPTYLHAFGKEYYGIFLLAFELPQILGFLDLGASKSILRFTSQYRQDKDINKFKSALSVNITLASFTSLIVALCILCIGLASSSIYHLNVEQYKIAIGLFTVSAVSSFFVFLDLIPQNILNGLNIFHERNKFQLVSVFYSLCLLLCVKFIGISLFTFSVLFALGFVLIFAIDIWLIYRKNFLADITIKLAGFKQILASGLLRYNAELFGLSLIAVFSSQADKQIIGVIVGVQAVTIYVVITKAYYVCKSLLGNFYNVLRPTLASVKSYPAAYVQKLFLTASQSISLVLFLISVYIFFLWPFLSNIWMHSNEYAHFSPFVSLSIINLAIASVSAVFISYFALTDEAFIVVKTDFLSVLLNVIISIISCIKYGAVGAIIGTTAQMIVNAVWYVYLGRAKGLINYSTYFSSSYLLALSMIIFDYIILFCFNLSALIQLLIALITTIIVGYHLSRLHIFSIVNSKKIALV